MPELTCANCGTDFDTDRDAVVPGQDMDRCPDYGAAHDVPVADGGGETTETVTVTAGDEASHLHIHIHRE